MSGRIFPSRSAIAGSIALLVYGFSAAAQEPAHTLQGPINSFAPVVEKGATSRRLYLPRGIWYDFWTGDRIEGPREYDRAVDLISQQLRLVDQHLELL